MNLSRYLEVRKAVIDLAESTANKKRMSYTAGNEDVLFNFKSDSEFVGNDPMQNVMTHLMKQIRGVASFVQHPDVEPSETLMSRAADVINYVTLMVAVAVDQGRQGVGMPLLDNPMFSLVALSKDDEEKAKVLNDFYAYQFGGVSEKRYTPLHKDEILFSDTATFGKDDV